MERKEFDLAVIGAGPGGYVAAIKGAQRGLKTCLIDKGALGGTCLNVGCIPTKTLLAGADVLHQVRHAAEFGITTGPVALDYSRMHARKVGIVGRIGKGLEGLLTAHGVTILRGHAEFVSPREIKVQGQDNLLIGAPKAIIATGSEPLDIPAFPCDHKKVFNSTSILDMTVLPKSLAIIGGGYIGCEFASLFATLGVKVTILEALPSLVMAQGKSIAEALTRAFTEQGIEVCTSVQVEGIDHVGGNLSVRLAGHSPLLCESALVAVGRKVVSSGLGLDKAGVAVGEKGVIVVDEKMQTSVPDIYAIGDVTGKAMLAHAASHQGIVAAENASGHTARMHYEAIPAVIFTHPEIAMVGLTLEQAQAAGHAAAIGAFPFRALGKAIAAAETNGFAQVVIDTKTRQILGAQVVGASASNLIAEMGLAIASELTVDCLTDTVHAHPTLSEAWMEAALIATGAPLHLPPRRGA